MKLIVVNWLNNLRSAMRLLLCFCIALGVFAAALAFHVQIITGVMLSWDAFCFCLLVLCWTIFLNVPQKELSRKAKQEDETQFATFALVLASVCVSLIGIIALMKNVDDSLVRKELHKAISLIGVALSWGVLHTVFTLRYAHLFYSDDANAPAPHTGGLDFPEEEEPDYMDFAYFSFVVGMTFQVSDVEVRSKLIRKVVLLHGFISFVFNTAIVALTISIISNSGH